jgi:hypothetical protein
MYIYTHNFTLFFTPTFFLALFYIVIFSTAFYFLYLIVFELFFV